MIRNTFELLEYDMQYYVYMIECINNHYYTGYTTDVLRRYKEHENGSVKCKYTRSFKPVKLAAYWTFNTRTEAMRIEKRIKQLSRNEKVKLIEKNNLDEVIKQD